MTFGESIYYDTWDKAERHGKKQGKKEGKMEGKIEGKIEGKKEGRIEGILLSIRNLMESMGWSAQETMKNMQIPESERSTYEALLKQ